MLNAKIERPGTSIYNRLILSTIGAGLFFLAPITKEIHFEKNALEIIEFLSALGAIMLIYTGIVAIKNRKLINTDYNNDIYKMYFLKSLRNGLYVIVSSIVIFLVVSFFSEFTLRTSLMFILYLGVMSVNFSQVIYYKNTVNRL